MNFIMDNFSDLKEFLSEPKKIIITTHHKPDGDAIGSSLALYAYLIQKGHEVNVIVPNDYAPFLQWLPNNDIVVNFEQEHNKSLKLLNRSDIVFCLDFNKLHRINDLGDIIEKLPGKKVMIDHHPEPDDFADYTMSNIKACSTAELIYDFIEMMGDESLVNKDIGVCVYVGIITDTGSFRYAATSVRVHEIAAKILALGIHHEEIHNKIYNSFSEDKMHFFGHCLSNKLKVFHQYNVALIAVSYDEIKEFNVKTGDTEGLVNFGLSISGIKMAALIIEREHLVKLSLRSIGDIDVNKIAKKYFEGGGHKNAAGGKSHKSLDEVVAIFTNMLPVEM